MRIAICEDEKLHADLLVSIIRKWEALRKFKPFISVFESAESFLTKWSSDNTYDLLFLDIQMRHMNGMELAESIRRLDPNMEIVFVTGLKDFVFRGYEVRALHYLLKPPRIADCISVLDKAKTIVDSRKDDTFIVPVETQSVRLLMNDIFYFESFSHYVDVYSNRGVFRYRDKLTLLETRLPKPRFFRCHRSYIVNMYHICLINREQLEIDNGKILPVAQARWADLNQAYLLFHDTRRRGR